MPEDKFEIICACGTKTMTHYLEGKCECGMPWKIEWNEAAREYNRQTKTRIVKPGLAAKKK